MKIIKDAKGREYCLNLTYGAIEKIRASVGVDLLDVAHLDLDGVRLARVLVAAVELKDIEPQAFMDAMDGDTIEAAGAALWEELLRFFPSSRRETIRKMFAAAEKVIDRKVESAKEKLESGEMEKLFERILSEPSGSSPASAASTPGPSPSDNST